MTEKTNIFQRLIHLKPKWAILSFILLDLFSIGLGMGVPFFTILLGLPVGWWLARRLGEKPQTLHALLGSLLKYAALTAAFSMLVLAVIWLPSLKWLFDPSADLANYGMPLILFEPLASFIGWQVLMVLISPFLQMLMTVFGAVVTWWREEEEDRKLFTTGK
ncbi:hypothetical protein JR338_10905 [Chloroflexota bacterium]|nr:hypothetical protein JR338_10905 [Chloroflexota bacterium]